MRFIGWCAAFAGIAPGPGPRQVVFEGVCPYRGLQVFRTEDAPFFFGREALTEWLLTMLRPAPNNRQEDRVSGHHRCVRQRQIILGPCRLGSGLAAR